MENMVGNEIKVQLGWNERWKYEISEHMKGKDREREEGWREGSASSIERERPSLITDR
jgi:hypothetical protein